MQYHKIDSIYKRDDRGNFLPEMSRPEFEYLANNLWVWTEKVDGTNIRIHYSGAPVDDGPPLLYLRGKTDNADIPTGIVQWFNDYILPMKDAFIEKFSVARVTLYGEGYGAKIQNGGQYRSDQGFILFDVKIDNWWLLRSNVTDIANYLGLHVVPVFDMLTLYEAIERVKPGIQSIIAPERNMEGLVGTPEIPLFARNGDRIITKVKTRDFK